jgi:hypothetical protein
MTGCGTLPREVNLLVMQEEDRSGPCDEGACLDVNEATFRINLHVPVIIAVTC